MKTPAPKLTSAHPNSRADIDHFPRIYSRPLPCSATNVHAPESTLEHRVSRLARPSRSPWRHHRHRVLRNAARDSWRLTCPRRKSVARERQSTVPTTSRQITLAWATRLCFETLPSRRLVWHDDSRATYWRISASPVRPEHLETRSALPTRLTSYVTSPTAMRGG